MTIRPRPAILASTVLMLAGSTFVVPALWERPLALATPPATAAARTAGSARATAVPGVPGVPGTPAETAPTPQVPGATTITPAVPTPPATAGTAGTAGTAEPSLTTAISAAAEAISPSVVQIRVEVRPRGGSGGGGGMSPFGVPSDERVVEGSGSGFVMRNDGYIITNNHVVENAIRIEVQLNDRRRYTARLVGADPAIDLAVIKIDARDLVAARFADSDVARVGQWVVAVGAPFGLDYTVTAGVLSATGRGNLGANEIEDYLQTDASINPGNSGGPLVTLDGSVIGINAMIIGRGTGIGFAIPSDLARHVATQIVEDGRVRRAWLGVTFQEMTPELATFLAPNERRGALINGVVGDGPAGRAGAQPGDVIIGIDGNPVGDGHDLLRRLLREEIGHRIELSVLRSGTARNLTVTLAERPGSATATATPAPTPAPNGGIGLAIDTLDPMLRQRLRYRGPGQLVVRDVTPGSAADHAGLRPGDVIVELDRVAVRNVDDVRAQLRDGRALVDVARADRRFYTVLEGSPH